MDTIYDIDQIYFDTMANLRCLVENHQGSIAKFAKTINYDHSSLVKLLNNKSPSDMSVGTFLKSCVELGIIKEGMVSETQFRIKLSLKEYMQLVYNPVFEAILHINWS